MHSMGTGVLALEDITFCIVELLYRAPYSTFIQVTVGTHLSHGSSPQCQESTHKVRLSACSTLRTAQRGPSWKGASECLRTASVACKGTEHFITTQQSPATSSPHVRYCTTSAFIARCQCLSQRWTPTASHMALMTMTTAQEVTETTHGERIETEGANFVRRRWTSLPEGSKP